MPPGQLREATVLPHPLTIRRAGLLALVLAVTCGCDPSGGTAAPSASSGEAAPVYRLGVLRSHAVVVVLESTGSVDAVGAGLQIAVLRADAGADGGKPALREADVARIAGGRLRPVRTGEPLPPIGNCVSVTPWSGADTFVGGTFADPAEPDVRLTQFVLRFPDAAAAAEGALRVRHQFEDCEAAGPGGPIRARSSERPLASGAGEVFVGERVGAGA